MKEKILADKVILQILSERKHVLRKYGVKKIGLFGSHVRGEQKEDSDIDLLVEFEKPNFDHFMDLVIYLEELFGRRVDILTPAGVRGIRIKKVAESIERSVVYV